MGVNTYVYYIYMYIFKRFYSGEDLCRRHQSRVNPLALFLLVCERYCLANFKICPSAYSLAIRPKTTTCAARFKLSVHSIDGLKILKVFCFVLCKTKTQVILCALWLHNFAIFTRPQHTLRIYSHFSRTRSQRTVRYTFYVYSRDDIEFITYFHGRLRF